MVASGTAGEEALQEAASAGSAAPCAPATRDPIWEVVGGIGKGGIIVRYGRGLASEQVPGRLSARALVRQVELDRGRLHYELVTGTGPERGWVSVRMGGKALLVERRDISVPASAAVEGEAADEAASGSAAVAALPTVAPGKRSLIIFDWDDTLLPLTWIEQKRLRQLQMQRTTETMEIWDQLATHAQAVVGLLRVARSLGAVAVVTLAQRPWVSESARDFLPGAVEEVCGLDVFYAFEQRVGKLPVGACPFTAKKASAMRRAISLLSSGEDSTLDGMISIGDSDIEKQAAKEVAQDCMANGKLKWSKIVKLRERPSVAELTEQIAKLRAELPGIVAPRADGDGA